MNEPFDAVPLCFLKDGAQRFQGALTPFLVKLRAALDLLPKDQAGLRIKGVSGLQPFFAPDGALGSIAASALGAPGRAVRAILFDKTPRSNWSLAWHQDRTICVKQRINVEGFGPWTTKGGMQHVAPPFEVLARMITLRAHLDDVPATNAPLLIAPGSHAVGRVPVGEIDKVIRRCGTRTCLADAGDVWLYATPILHASEASTAPVHRRVLQVDFTSGELPGGLEWHGV